MNQPTIDVQHYQEQLDQKKQQLQALLAPFAPPTLEVFASKPLHYRMRAEFRVWHEDDALYYVMFDQKTKQRYRVEQFLPASELINQAMPQLLQKIAQNSTLRKKLFQVDFLSTLSGELLISLLYHKTLDKEWQEQAQQLKAALAQEGINADLIGRAHKQKWVIGKEHVIERLRVNEKEYIYQQVENSFTQPNATVAQKMLEWAQDCTQESQGDLLELYCGNGNFSLALAKNFEKVLATEISKSSVAAAQYNIVVNKINNVQILRLSAEEFTQALAGVREFNRLKAQQIDLNDYQCETVLVDPPRAGLDDATCRMVQNYRRILYISCNPQTLLQNLQTLAQTHKITRFALFDQFPYTHHAEAGVLLEKFV
ncbi:MAG: tRNA (uridine(54)-C5)-methyltransferase TrmA [Vibrionaceae bacterium]